MRPHVHIVDTEPTTPWQRLASVIDSANGIGAVLNPLRFVYMNTDTVMHVHRIPQGDEFGVRARMSVGPTEWASPPRKSSTARGISVPARRPCWFSGVKRRFCAAPFP